MKEGDYLNEIIKNTVEREGGYVNHSADKGGPTRYGITESVARKNGYNGDMKKLPLVFAVEVYKKQYWDSIRLDEIDDEIMREFIFDAAVNHGTSWAVRFAQRAYNTLNKQTIAEDGKIGPQTISALNEYQYKQDLNFWYLTIRGRYFYDIIDNDSSQKTFARGWGRRLQELMEKI